MPLNGGDRLGPYEIESMLGAGGMGEVYRARDLRLGRAVAVKVLTHEARDSPAQRQRFAREAQTLAAVNHPNVCQIFDIGEHQGEPFLAMELLSGRPLEERLHDGALPAAEALAAGRQMLQALAALHRCGILHRDLKPSNIFLTPHGVKLLDFGLARAQGPAPHAAAGLTESGTILGTPRYMPPEQWAGQPLTPAADLFAFAAVLFEMLTGRPAFGGQNIAEIFHAIHREHPPALAGAPGIEAIDRALRRGLAKRPEDRYANAEAMERDLGQSSDFGGLGAPGAVGAATPTAVRTVTRLLVFPFRLVPPDPELDFLGPALAEAVAASLSGLSSLAVRAPRAAARFGDSPDLQIVAAEAQVDAVLFGTLQRAGQRVRLSTQLVEAPSATLLASPRSEAPLGDLFELQDTLSQCVVEALRVPLSQADRGQLAGSAPADPEAYALYLRGTDLATRTADASALRRARDLLRQAVDRDPDFAPAWARLGRVHRILGKFGHEPAAQCRPLARQAFERALALEPDLPLAHNLYTHFEIEDLASPTQAMLRLLAQVEKHPADAELCAGLVVACRYCGLLDASLAAHDRARRMDPSVPTSVHYTIWMRGSYAEALAADRDPVGWIRLYSLVALERADEVRAEYRRWQETLEPGHEISAGACVVAAFEGDREATLREVEKLTTGGFSDAEGLYFSARSLARVGEAAAALAMLEGIVAGGFTCAATFRADAWLSGLRDDPAFAALLLRADEAQAHASRVFERAGGPRLLGLPAERTSRLPSGSAASTSR